MKALLTLIISFIVLSLSAQYYYNSPAITPGGNPGNLNNDIEKPYGDGLPAGWVNIQPAVHPGWTTVQNIPFTFNFNGAPVTQYKVSTTGVLTFTTTAVNPPLLPNLSLPNANIPDKSVCIWGLDYGGSFSNDAICVKTFGTAPNRQQWVLFASYSTNASGFQCYNYFSIVLEETSDRIYIVDQLRAFKFNCQPSLTLGIQINSTTAEMVAGSPNVHSLAGTSDTPADNEYYEFIHGSKPSYDAEINWLQTNPYLGSTGPPQELKGTIKNYGLVAITSYDINYQVNNGPIKTSTETMVNIPTNGDDWFFHDSMWSPPTTGTYEIKVWASNLNGSHVDENHLNDTLYKTVLVMGVFVPKLLLHEVFTSSTCDPCKEGNDNLYSILSNHPGAYTWISYQMDYPFNGDLYYTADGGIRRAYYGIDSIPDMVVSGVDKMYPPAYSETKFTDFSQPAYLHTSPTHAIAGTTVTVNATLIPFESNPSTTLKTHIAIVERTTTGNVSTNGETQFRNVLKKMVPDANGTSVGPFIAGINPAINKSYTFPAGHTVEQMSDLAVIVFVQDMATGHILQSAWSTLSSGIEQYDEDGNGLIAVYPNPAADQVSVKFELKDAKDVRIQIMDLAGRVIYTERFGQRGPSTYVENIDLSKLSSGTYLVRLILDERTYHNKVVVK